MKNLRLAIGFLTVLPFPYRGEYQPGDLGRAAGWYPFAGMLLGCILAAAYMLLSPLLPPFVLAVLIVGLWAMLTGGLHLDGLADCGDGLLAAVSRERRLEIMKDPRLGTFGGMALVLHLLLKASLVAALPPAPGLIAALLAAPVVARWLILIVGKQPMARPDGLGVEFALGVNRRTFVYAAVLPLAMLLIGGLRGVVGALLAHAVMYAIIRLAKARLGGVTGDVLGLTVELGESAVLLGFVLQLPIA